LTQLNLGLILSRKYNEPLLHPTCFVALIGRQWLTVTDENGQRRLDNADDAVRLEIQTAFDQKIRVIPILFQGATMPSAAALPPEIGKLSRLNAMDISDRRWDYDISVLIETLESILPKRPATSLPTKAPFSTKEVLQRFQGWLTQHLHVSPTAMMAIAMILGLAILSLVTWKIFHRPGGPAVPNANDNTPMLNSDVPMNSNRSETGTATYAQPIDQITRIAVDSSIAQTKWDDQVAPPGYIKGMAMVYARVYCKLKDGDAAVTQMAKASTSDVGDALAWYQKDFQAVGMNNDRDGADTLRHLFVLLFGLGMHESRGRYCGGRDEMNPNSTNAETAEAGLFQTSASAISATPLMQTLFDQYSANPSGFAGVFEEGVSCRRKDFSESGSGTGYKFQQLSKDSPAFAAEFAALGLRTIKSHWGPVHRRQVEIRPECDAMFRRVQETVERSSLCAKVRQDSHN
jgi:hypothetical protein